VRSSGSVEQTMWISEHPYLALYLSGSILVVLLSLLKVILFHAVDWFIKGNILRKNLKKISPPDKKSILEKIGVFISTIVVEALLSWINVVVIIWQILVFLLHAVRNVVSSVPEEIKQLRFPLTNNPNMSREFVWAYGIALLVKTGSNTLTKGNIIHSIKETLGYYKTFDYTTALDKLCELRVVDSAIINSVKEYMKKWARDDVNDYDDDDYDDEFKFLEL
jgi:hypothetical protein